MKNFISLFLAVILASPAYASPSVMEARKTPERSRSSSKDPDQSGGRGRTGNGPDDVSDERDRGNSGRGGYGDVDWTWGGNGGSRGDYTDRFLALREVFQTVDSGFKNQVQTELNKNIGFWATVIAATSATWIYIKTNPSKALPKVFAKASGAAALFGAASAIARPNFEAMANDDAYLVFTSKAMGDDKAIELAHSKNIRPQIENIIEVSDEILCSNLKNETNLSVIRFCNLK